MDGDTFAEESAVLDELAVLEDRPTTPGDSDSDPDATDDAGADDVEDTAAHGPRDEPAPPETGDQVVDGATAEVAATGSDPLETRLAAYERAHRTLQDRLADVEG
jgi:hypothetical protein